MDMSLLQQQKMEPQNRLPIMAAESDNKPSSSNNSTPLQAGGAGLLKSSSQARNPTPGPVHRTLASAGNLANLLPTGTVLVFQALTPSFSNGGACHVANTVLTSILVGFFSLVCFLSSFTDSFVSPTTGKIYYGIATFKGLYVFNVGEVGPDEDQEDERGPTGTDLSKYRVRLIDFVHAFVSLLVFLVLAITDPHILKCFFGDSATTWKNALIDNLPLGAGALSSFLFMLFPTNRRGIGYADMAAKK